MLGRRTLPQIRAELGDCTRCKLHSTRRSIVFGVGAPDTPLMFVGEAPGEQEDRHGEPFVGPAGQLLDKMIEAMGWTRATVYIANTTKCRLPGNRNPQPDELVQCMPFPARPDRRDRAADLTGTACLTDWPIRSECRAVSKG